MKAIASSKDFTICESNVLSECSESKETTTFTVYILRSSTNQLYIGQTNNLPRRLKKHLQKQEHGAKFTKEHDDFRLVYTEEFSTLLETMRREKQLKGWKRAKKEALIAGDLKLLKKL